MKLFSERERKREGERGREVRVREECERGMHRDVSDECIEMLGMKI